MVPYGDNDEDRQAEGNFDQRIALNRTDRATAASRIARPRLFPPAAASRESD
jgi:hypothetical protein